MNYSDKFCGALRYLYKSVIPNTRYILCYQNWTKKNQYNQQDRKPYTTAKSIFFTSNSIGTDQYHQISADRTKIESHSKKRINISQPL